MGPPHLLRSWEETKGLLRASFETGRHPQAAATSASVWDDQVWVCSGLDVSGRASPQQSSFPSGPEKLEAKGADPTLPGASGMP